MGALFRSEDMNLVQLYIQHDAAHDTFDELGELGLVQFHDLNPNVNAFQRNFVNEVKKCDDMERRLRYLRGQLEKEEKTLKLGETLVSVSGIAPPSEPARDAHDRPVFDIEELDVSLEQTEKEMREANDNYDELKGNFADLLETMHVLQKDSTFFDATVSEDSGNEAGTVMADEEEEHAGTVPDARAQLTPSGALQVSYVSGVVLSAKANLFERVLWRALHGNLYFKLAEIDDDEIVDAATGEPIEKAVFVVFFHGQQSQMKIRKICDAFGARVVDVPNDRRARAEMLADVRNRLKDLRVVMSHSQTERRQVLARVSVAYADWAAFVRREKSIYNVMNMCNFDAGRKSLIAEGWVPAASTEAVASSLNEASRRCGTQASIMSIVRTKETPPTYFRTNEFTECFHTIVESYGVATYGEVNPAALSVITFPFLFAIMFGDGGHAILLLLAAITMCLIYPKLKGKPMNEIFDLLFFGRYLLVLMGVFSIYTGLIYNDFFSISLPFFDNSYHTPDGARCVYNKPCVKDSSTYPFGVDYIWRRADNELFLSNSLKMKLSIVFGVVQMEAGIVMSLFNHIHFKHTIDIFFEFIPQILFMTCTFGYLVFLIFYKWLAKSITPSAPFLINVFIDMFISFGKLSDEEKLFDGQNALQVALAVIVVVSALALLIPKPIIEYVMHKRKTARSGRGGKGPAIFAQEHEDDEIMVRTPLMDEGDHRARTASTATTTTTTTTSASHADAGHADGDDEEGQFSFADAFINNAIHGIEFILGCISNTASYLRLWALSLAHAQLSVVFYEQLFLRGLTSANFVLNFVCFAAWGGVTIAILLGMEALSAFLHGLRLHWVEFMNKFYLAEGYAFAPFSFKRILEHVNDDDSQQ